MAAAYVQAVAREVDFYAELVGRQGNHVVLHRRRHADDAARCGLAGIVERVRGAFNLQCDLHMESHPNHLGTDNLRAIRSMGSDHVASEWRRSPEAPEDAAPAVTVEGVRAAVGRAVSAGFKCVNVDVMFALPGQTEQEVEDTGRALVDLGVDQVAAYPLFLFPYTAMGRSGARNTRRRREPQETEDAAHPGVDLLQLRVRADVDLGVHQTGSAEVPVGIPCPCMSVSGRVAGGPFS